VTITSEDKPTVVLLHGLLRTGRSMARLERALQRAGYPTYTGRYLSQRQSIEDSARGIARELAALGRPLVLVTHSLGGILARYIAGPLAAEHALTVERILMLAPPNAGSRLARRLSPSAAIRRVYGPAMLQLGTEHATWPVPEVPIAIVAGTRAGGLNPAAWFSRATGYIKADEPSDGTVLVEETHLPGMVDFATVHVGHTFIMDDAAVHEMVLHFLAHGTLCPR
jgi:triacylglycerol lipase